MNKAPTRRWSDEHMAIAVLAVIFSIAQWHLVEQVLGAGYLDSINETHSVVWGKPHWRVYQNRVLGPYIVQLLSYATPSYEAAYLAFCCSCLAAAGYLVYLLGTLVNGRPGGLISFFLLQGLFPLCLDHHWLFVWDIIDILTFTLFFILVVREASWWWMLLLFSVALFNRETALFFALWLVIDPLCRWGLGRLDHGPRRALNWPSIAAGALCLPLGVMVIEKLRTGLLIEEVGIRNGAPSGLNLTDVVRLRIPGESRMCDSSVCVQGSSLK